MSYFGSNNVESVAVSGVEAEICWVGVAGAGSSWMELGEVGARFSNTHIKCPD